MVGRTVLNARREAAVLKLRGLNNRLRSRGVDVGSEPSVERNRDLRDVIDLETSADLLEASLVRIDELREGARVADDALRAVREENERLARRVEEIEQEGAAMIARPVQNAVPPGEDPATFVAPNDPAPGTMETSDMQNDERVHPAGSAEAVDLPDDPVETIKTPPPSPAKRTRS